MFFYKNKKTIDVTKGLDIASGIGAIYTASNKQTYVLQKKDTYIGYMMEGFEDIAKKIEATLQQGKEPDFETITLRSKGVSAPQKLAL